MAGPDHHKTALITGGGGGLGRAMAKALLEDGLDVVLMDRNAAACEAVAADLKALPTGRVLAVPGDVTDVDACAYAVDQCIAQFGRLDILVNNAGIGVAGIRPNAEVNPLSIEELTPDIWRRFFDINTLGPVWMTRAALPHLKARGWGRIINVTTSFYTMLRMLPYGASKSALEATSAVWAKELEGSGVNVNVLVPGGPTDTPMVGDGIGIPRDKMLRPEVMAAPLRWLASEESNDANGLRFVGGHWDPNLEAATAAAKAGAAIGWPELGRNVVWHGVNP